MKKVILVRHGKSSWAEPELEDHERPLNKRGRRAAPVVAQWLAHRKHLPDRVVCSSSRRTRQTVSRMSAAIPDLPEPVIEETLYHATPDAMLECLRRMPKDCDTVMLVGHQPGLSAFARKLTNGSVRPRCAQAFEHFPTAAAAVLELDIDDWSELDYHMASFVDFARPRELMDE